jgi:hypothetical protein
MVVYGPLKAVQRFRDSVRGGKDNLPVAYAEALERVDWERGVNPLDLDKLRPPDEKTARAFAEKLGGYYYDPKWNTWDVNVYRIRTVKGISRLTYSFMTAWGEPVGPIAYGSLSYPELCFVLGGIDVGSHIPFSSYFIRRGRVRYWEMPEKTANRFAVMDRSEEDGEVSELYADYQPRIMKELLAHWDGVIERIFSRRGKIKKK